MLFIVKLYVCVSFGVVSNYVVFLFLFSSTKAGILRPAVGAGKGKMKLHDLLMCGFCSVANGEIEVVRRENLALEISVQSIIRAGRKQLWRLFVWVCWGFFKESRMLINTFHLFILPQSFRGIH